MNTTYLKFEIIRTLRNRQSFIFSLIFPLVMFLILGVPNRNTQNFGESGIPAITYYMIGIWAGHTFSQDAMGPLMGGSMSLFAIAGGSWFPLGTGIIATIGSWTPSYWIVQAGHIGVGGSGWPLKAWLVVLLWTAAFGALAARAYQSDTKRA
jgi:hypothetical protein